MKQTDNFKFDEANVMNELVYRNLSEDAKRKGCTPLKTARWTTSAHWRPPSI